jgi:L-ascorbate 6-phosphate lactonase
VNTSQDGLFWPRDFLDEVEGHCVTEGVVLWSVGGPSLIVRSPLATLYVDPFFATIPEHRRSIAIPINPEQVTTADVLLSTHKHVDHCHEGSFSPIARNTGALCAGPQSSVRMMEGFESRPPCIQELSTGDRLVVKDIEVFALPACDPAEEFALCYLIRAGGVGILIGGDTRDCPGLADIGARFTVDVAFLAFASRWHMGAQELLQAAGRLHTKVAIPYHWELFHGYTRSPLEFCGAWTEATPAPELRLLFLGDRLWLRKEHAGDQGEHLLVE